MKEVYSYQEISTDISQGENVAFTFHPIVHVALVRKSLESQAITATIEVYIGDECFGIFEQEYVSIQAVLNAFDLPDHVELFEIVEE